MIMRDNSAYPTHNLLFKLIRETNVSEEVGDAPVSACGEGAGISVHCKYRVAPLSEVGYFEMVRM
jgi:hypothetical protein